MGDASAEQQADEACLDDCTVYRINGTQSVTSDGFCDDGGEGSETRICQRGADCTDCGPRWADLLSPPSPPP